MPLAAVPFVPLAARGGERASWLFATAAASVSLLASLYGALTFSSPATESAGAWLPSLGLSLQVKVDGLSTLVSVLVSFLSLLVLVYSLGYMKGERGQARYYSLVLLFVGSMLGLVMAGNLIQLYLFWEMVGICSALLIAFWSDRDAARRAGLKAFVTTHVGDAALLVAVVLLSSSVGSTSIDSVLQAVGGVALSGGTLLTVGVLVFIGAMGKSAQVPLHAWLPDAMEGPTTVSALIHAATMVNAGVYLVLRLFPLFQSSAVLMELVLSVGLLSAALGAVSAIAAEDLKRILAYSTISQLGLMFVGIGLGSSLGATYHMVSQGLFKALAFLAAGSVIHVLGTRNVEEMGGLRRTMKYTYAGFLLSALAMSGMPPLIGFWSKDAIVSAALSSSGFLALVVSALSVATTVYSLRAVIKVFHGTPSSQQPSHEPPLSMLLPVGVLSASVVVGWLVLGSQRLLPMSSVSSPGLSTFVLSVGALGSGLVIAYVCFSARANWVGAAMERSRALRALRACLLDGLGFDTFYSLLGSSVANRVSRIAARLQTGLLGDNVALLLILVIVLMLVVSLGVA